MAIVPDYENCTFHSEESCKDTINIECRVGVNNLKNILSEDEFNEVFEKLESYMELTNSTIPDLENELLELENSVKDYADELEKLYRDNLK